MDKRQTILFTTIGALTDESYVNTSAAFSSWEGFDVVVFGEDTTQHIEICDKYGFTLDVEYERTEFGLPLVRGLFDAIKRYDGYDVYCYINSDIQFPKSPQCIIDLIEFENFLLVGQRLDRYPDGFERLHNPGGIDYYFYTSDFWDLKDMPDFSIARGRFDHWLMGRALRSGTGPVIDITADFKVIHPEPKDRKPGDPASLYQRCEFALGYQILRNQYHFSNAKLHGQINYAPYKLIDGVLYNDESVYTDEFNQIIKNDILL